VGRSVPWEVLRVGRSRAGPLEELDLLYVHLLTSCTALLYLFFFLLISDWRIFKS
jgi:hypothetical protein